MLQWDVATSFLVVLHSVEKEDTSYEVHAFGVILYELRFVRISSNFLDSYTFGVKFSMLYCVSSCDVCAMWFSIFFVCLHVYLDVYARVLC